MPSEYMETHDLSRLVTALRRPAVATYPPGATLGPRSRRDFEFVWVTAGRAEWAWIDGGEELVLEPGTLLLTRPGMREEYRWGRNAPTRHGFVHFEVQPRPDTTGWPLLRPSSPPGPIAGLLDYLLWLAEEPVVAWLEHAGDTVATLLRIFLSGPLPEPDPPAEHPALTAALDHVRREWAPAMRPLTLAELAVAARTSKEHLARLFRRRYGMGMIHALELVRLDRAETLLTRTNMNVAEVARSCGFADPLHFSRRFRGAYGSSPRAYRQAGAAAFPVAAAGLLTLSRRVTAA